MARFNIIINATDVQHPISPAIANSPFKYTKYKLSAAITFALLSSMSSSAFAAPPVAYDGWTVTAGVIDTSISCSGVGVTCTELAPAENGFKYEEVESDGSKFFRLILTEPNATGDPLVTSGAGELSFTTESYIPFALVGEGIAQGVATKQIVRDSANFQLSAEIQKGNMRGLYATNAEDMFSTKIAQTLSSASNDFNSAFDFTNYTAFSTVSTSNNPDTNTEIGRQLSISQNTLVGSPGDTSKKQTFEQRQVSGAAGNLSYTPWYTGPAPGLKTKFMVNGNEYFITSPLTAASSVTLPVTSNGIAVVPAASNTVSWANQDDISTTWVAQSSNSPTNPTGVGMNYQSVSNNTTNIEASATLLEILPTTADPFAWDANFGAAPTFP